MASPLNQTAEWSYDSDIPIQINWTGNYDPSTCQWVFLVSNSPAPFAPILGLTPTVTVGTVTNVGGVYSTTFSVPIPRSQARTYLPVGTYYFGFWNTTFGLVDPSAAGQLRISAGFPGPP